MGLTIAITGAGGFIGAATVETALRRGHQVRALVRRDGQGDFPPEVEVIALDLAGDPDMLAHALDQVDAVIHLAASMSGKPGRAARDTVTATENLLAGITENAPEARLVLVSSIVVYDAKARDITEDTALDLRPQDRDTYARAKLAQEAKLDAYAGETWIARPGAVFGPGRLWNAHLGPKFGPLLLRLGSDGELPLLTLDNCAEALVMMAETPVGGDSPRAVNLVESDLPTRERFLKVLDPVAPRFQLRFPWRLLLVAGMVLGLIPSLRRRLPGLLQPRTLRARYGAKSYSNARAESDLPWRSRKPFENAMNSAIEASS